MWIELPNSIVRNVIFARNKYKYLIVLFINYFMKEEVMHIDENLEAIPGQFQISQPDQKLILIFC